MGVLPDAAWLGSLETGAADVVACWRVAGSRQLYRELRERAPAGSAARVLEQQEAVGEALSDALLALPDSALGAPGGEEDWNVAQTFAHATAARRFLATWAALDAGGTWPEERSPVVRPSIPGEADATREQLLALLDKSRRALRDAAARIQDHERQRCGLRHPLIGRLRCGEWLLFVGVHDLMHLEQLHRLRG